ncbi:MAG: aldo/keto reductase [Desulfohalobiaceae bacterium]|nr:aldo/keto reductase [Desulfohalobiaceae bacterium]
MLFREVPKTGDKLSILGYGCMRLPETNGRIDEETSAGLIHTAIDNGVNYLDTAWPYHCGESEAFLGRILSGPYREKVKLATKLPPWMIRTRQDMDAYLNAQLDKLQTDSIDYYLIHALNGRHWDRLLQLGLMDFLDRAKADGRVRNTGFSFHGLLPDFKRIVDGYPWEICQIQYNYLDEELQAGTEGLIYAADRDLGVVIMEPLRGGTLGLPDPPLEVRTIWEESDRKRSPAEWALRWVWNHPEVTTVLSGMNDEDHIRENLRLAGEARSGTLGSDEKELIRRAADTYREIMKVLCTGCGYCLPCPEGVDIPACFDSYNTLHMFKQTEETKFRYALRNSGLISGESGYASQCAQCGECLEKCPQGLLIPDILEQVAAELEDRDMEKRVATARQLLNMT